MNIYIYIEESNSSHPLFPVAIKSLPVLPIYQPTLPLTLMHTKTRLTGKRGGLDNGWGGTRRHAHRKLQSDI